MFGSALIASPKVPFSASLLQVIYVIDNLKSLNTFWQNYISFLLPSGPPVVSASPYVFWNIKKVLRVQSIFFPARA